MDKKKVRVRNTNSTVIDNARNRHIGLIQALGIQDAEAYKITYYFHGKPPITIDIRDRDAYSAAARLLTEYVREGMEVREE